MKYHKDEEEDYIEYPKFGHWLMSGQEFDKVSSDCLKWIAMKLNNL